MMEFTNEVTTLIDAVKDGAYGDRQERIEAIECLIDQHVEDTGKTPDNADLMRLGTVILREEYSDRHPDKMTRDEYPIMTASQREEREKDEVSAKWGDETGTDGQNHARKTRDYNRKMREVTNGNLNDKYAKSRNAERRRKHTRFKSGKGGAVFKVSVENGEKCVMDGKKYHYYYNPKA